MIHKVFSDNKSFNEVKLGEGLNIILGVKNETSNDKNTMNGVGKTTLLEIIDFCLGYNIDKKSYLKKIKEIENGLSVLILIYLTQDTLFHVL